MSDLCTREEPDFGPRRPVTRRAVLGGTVALGAFSVAMDPAQARKSGERSVRVHRFDDTPSFDRGVVAQVVQQDGALTLSEGAASGTWTSPTLRPGFPATEVIASWNADTPAGSWVEIEVSGVTAEGKSTGWFVMGRWCADNPAQGGALERTSVDDQDTELVSIYTDTLAMAEDQTLTSYRLRARLRRGSAATSPSISLLSGMASALPDVKKVRTSAPGPARGITLDVPTYSQEVHIGHYPEWDNGGEAWCSPTSVAMVADFWKKGPSAADTAWVDVPPDEQVDHAARQTFDFAYDGCGNWPFNTAYAATLGLRGFITRLRSLREAETFIAAGIPLVMSVSFKKSELDGAGYSTNGHLMVLVGFDDAGDPVMNDPASHLIPDNNEVRVTYRRDQVENVWLPHSGGIVYVMHPEGTSLPEAPAQANW